MAMHLGEAAISDGAFGAEVKDLQQILTGQGYTVGPIDGIFGPLTKSAVQAFQKVKGLVPDGIVGPLTWDALRGKVAAASVVPTVLPGPVSAPKAGVSMTLALYGLGALAVVAMLFSGTTKRAR
jgi:peptidoglycan hydrolase-like protein with peptidoglycan-binding domain